MENPHEPREPGPYTARARSPQRRGADYHLPPIGNARILDSKHLLRQEWTGWLVMLLFIGGPIAWLIGIEFGWL